MIRNIIGSWAFAAFLVVVAVATWRLLDASRAPAAPHCPLAAHAAAVVVPEQAPQVAEPQQEAPPPVAHTCGAGGFAYDEAVNDAPVAQALSEREGQVMFESAVDAFRANHDAKACSILFTVMHRSASGSHFVAKSAGLFKARCR